MKTIKKYFTFIILISVMIITSQQIIAEEKNKDPEKVAEVNGIAVSKKEFDTEMKQFSNRIQAQGKPMDEAQLSRVKESIINNLVNTELLYQQSRKSGIKIDTETVTKQMKSLRDRYPDEEAYKKRLLEMGLKPEDVKNRITKGVAIQSLIDKEVLNKISITEKETRAFYDSNPQYFQQPEQIKASHILIKVEKEADDKAKAEAKKKIEGIKKKVDAGGDFAKLAKENSEGPSSTNGGDLGFFGRGKMVKPFEDTAFNMKVNDVSGIVETQFGYHLIKVTDKKAAGKIVFEDTKAKIEEFLKKQQADKGISEYIESLRKDAKIEVFI